MLNVPDKLCTENQNTHFVFNTLFPKIVPFIWEKNRQDTEDNIIRRTRFACCITKVRDTHPIFIIRGADNSLARPRRKQASIVNRMPAQQADMPP